MVRIVDAAEEFIVRNWLFAEFNNLFQLSPLSSVIKKSSCHHEFVHMLKKDRSVGFVKPETWMHLLVHAAKSGENSTEVLFPTNFLSGCSHRASLRRHTGRRSGRAEARPPSLGHPHPSRCPVWRVDARLQIRLRASRAFGVNPLKPAMPNSSPPSASQPASEKLLGRAPKPVVHSKSARCCPRRRTRPFRCASWGPLALRRSSHQ